MTGDYGEAIQSAGGNVDSQAIEKDAGAAGNADPNLFVRGPNASGHGLSLVEAWRGNVPGV